MLTVDMYHNHPIVKGFVHILKEEARSSRNAHKEKIEDNVEKVEMKNGHAGSRAILIGKITLAK